MGIHKENPWDLWKLLTNICISNAFRQASPAADCAVGAPQGGFSCPFGAIHLQVAERSEVGGGCAVCPFAGMHAAIKAVPHNPLSPISMLRTEIGQLPHACAQGSLRCGFAGGRRLVRCVLRNAGDGVPYGKTCRDTPPGVSGPHHQQKDRVKITTSLRGRRPWQSPGTPCGFVECPRRFPRRFAPRNDREVGTWSF